MTVISLPKRLSEIGRLGIPPVAGLREKVESTKVMEKKSTTFKGCQVAGAIPEITLGS